MIVALFYVEINDVKNTQADMGKPVRNICMSKKIRILGLENDCIYSRKA